MEVDVNIWGSSGVLHLLMDIRNHITSCICCYTTLWNINVSKTSSYRQITSVDTCLRCGGVLITKLRKVYCWVCEWKKIKSVNIRQSYMQERGCIVHFLCLFRSVSASAQSARDNQSLACNFAKYSPIKKNSLTHPAINFSYFGYQRPHHTLNM